jgi:hypothetical protein
MLPLDDDLSSRRELKALIWFSSSAFCNHVTRLCSEAQLRWHLAKQPDELAKRVNEGWRTVILEGGAPTTPEALEILRGLSDNSALEIFILGQARTPMYVERTLIVSMPLPLTAVELKSRLSNRGIYRKELRSDTRASYRLVCSAKLRLIKVDREVEAQLIDISEGGAQLQTTEKLGEKSLVLLDLYDFSKSFPEPVAFRILSVTPAPALGAFRLHGCFENGDKRFQNILRRAIMFREISALNARADRLDW